MKFVKIGQNQLSHDLAGNNQILAERQNYSGYCYIFPPELTSSERFYVY